MKHSWMAIVTITVDNFMQHKYIRMSCSIEQHRFVSVSQTKGNIFYFPQS